MLPVRSEAQDEEGGRACVDFSMAELLRGGVTTVMEIGGLGRVRGRARRPLRAPRLHGPGLPVRALAHAGRQARGVGVERGAGPAGTAPRGGLPRAARWRARRPRALLLLAGPDRHLHARAAPGSEALRGRGARAVPGAHLAVGGGVQRDGGPPRQDAHRLDARAGRARPQHDPRATPSSSAAPPGRTIRRATWRSWRTRAARWPTRSGSSRGGAWPWSRSRATARPASTCRSAPTPTPRA